ncbi:MAG: sugar phosphate isomerase/epimerase [bacterium]|nr:sugar phosphate isomerase/epimerase [bacterium]
MRFGCCGNMIAIEPDKTGIEIVEKIKEIGYDYIELSLAHISKLSEEEFERLKARLDASGLRCEACNNFFLPEIKLTGDYVDRKEIEKYLDLVISRAGILGVDVIVFGSGPAKMVPEGFPMEKAWQQLIELTRRISNLASRYNITIAIEPLRKEECNIINKTLEGLRMVKDVDRDNVKLLVDFYHLKSEGEDPSIIKECKGYLKHVHFARFEGRTFPRDIEEDELYLPFISNLKEIEYNERVSIEAYSSDFYNDAYKSLQFLKRYFG